MCCHLQIAPSVRAASEGWSRAWQILNDKSDWRLDQGKNLATGQVFYKNYQTYGRVVKLKVVYVLNHA